jgi:hypothetical protein
VWTRPAGLHAGAWLGDYSPNARPDDGATYLELLGAPFR